MTLEQVGHREYTACPFVCQGMVASVLLVLALLGAPIAGAQRLEEAMVAFERRDYPVAFEVFRALAEKGNAEAQNSVQLRVHVCPRPWGAGGCGRGGALVSAGSGTRPR